MTKSVQYLEAQFHRAHISRRDFKEAEDYLNALNNRRTATIQRALLLSAIISYSRPFTDNDKIPHKKATPRLAFSPSRELNEEELALHTFILELRNEALAHSEYNRKETNRIMASSTSFLVYSKPFDVLSQRIDRKLFKSLCKKMAMYCDTKLFELNYKIGPTPDAP